MRVCLSLSGPTFFFDESESAAGSIFACEMEQHLQQRDSIVDSLVRTQVIQFGNISLLTFNFSSYQTVNEREIVKLWSLEPVLADV